MNIFKPPYLHPITLHVTRAHAILSFLPPVNPCAALARCNGYDIVKRNSNRKNRYLVIIQAQLAPAASGRLVRLFNKKPLVTVCEPLRHF